MPQVTESQFQNILSLKLGTYWDRALKIFSNFGPNLAFDVTNVLLLAADHGKLDDALRILETHYQSHLQYQHPEIRGTISDLLLGINPTQVMFLGIYQDTLGLSASPK